MMLTGGIEADDGKIGPDVDDAARLGAPCGAAGVFVAATGVPARIPHADAWRATFCSKALSLRFALTRLVSRSNRSASH